MIPSLLPTDLLFSPGVGYPADGLKFICRPEKIRCLEINLAPNQQLGRGTVMCETGTRGLFEVFSGQAPARGILRFPVWVDANGLCTVDGPNERWPQSTFLTVPMFIAGMFLTRQLIGLTAQAVQTLGRIVDGTIEDGVLDMP